MSSPPDLSRVQDLFWDLITAPEGVEAGARDLVRRGRLASADLSFLVRGDERMAPHERLDIYASMYFYRLRDALAEDFPKTAAVTGGARFHNLITDYLLARPSTSWTLRDAGTAMPGFLATHPLGKEFPFLADLARLEWARIEAFDEADSEAITRETITALSTERMQTLRLGLVPACRLLDLSWSVAPAWLAIEQGDDSAAGEEIDSAAVTGEPAFEDRPPAKVTKPKKARTRVRAWRQDLMVYHVTIEADEHACLVEMRDRGATMPRLGEMVLARMEGARKGNPGALASAAARRMAGLVDLWLKEGLLREAPPAG